MEEFNIQGKQTSFHKYCPGTFGYILVDFLNSSNLEILNRGSEPTFCSGGRQEVIDITLGSYGLLESNAGWKVSIEPSLSDHRHILFTQQGSMPAPRSGTLGAPTGAPFERT